MLAQLKQNQTAVKKEKKCLILYLSELQSKSLCLCYYQRFLKEHDDKLIQESMKVFKEELHVLKKKQLSSVTSSDSNSSDLFVLKINANIIFSVLSDDF